MVRGSRAECRSPCTKPCRLRTTVLNKSISRSAKKVLLQAAAPPAPHSLLLPAALCPRVEPHCPRVGLMPWVRRCLGWLGNRRWRIRRLGSQKRRRRLRRPSRVGCPRVDPIVPWVRWCKVASHVGWARAQGPGSGRDVIRLRDHLRTAQRGRLTEPCLSESPCRRIKN